MTKKLLTVAGMAIVLAACTPTTKEVVENAENAVNNAQTTVEQTGEKVDEMVAEGEAMVDNAKDMMENAEAMEIDSFSYGYSVTELTMKPGETKAIKLTNSGGLHDFVIDELGVHSKDINEGETDTFTITIPDDAAPGTTYEYYCSIGNHRAQGMVGTLTVE